MKLACVLLFDGAVVTLDTAASLQNRNEGVPVFISNQPQKYKDRKYRGYRAII